MEIFLWLILWIPDQSKSCKFNIATKQSSSLFCNIAYNGQKQAEILKGEHLESPISFIKKWRVDSIHRHITQP